MEFNLSRVNCAYEFAKFSPQIWLWNFKVSKYYDRDCLQNFLLLFMSLLTAPIVKNSLILAGI